ncbi:ankyrin, partial [Stipitochalara longipes BDJ]
MIILQLAAELGHLEIVNLILEHLPQTVDPDSNHLALILAIGNGHEEVVKKLLEHVPMPMNLYSTGPAGLNALGIAVKNGRIHMVQLILDKTHVKPDEYVEDWDNKRTRKSALHLAAEGGHKSIMEAFLFCAKVNLNVNDAKGTSPLLTAVECDQIGIVELLLADNRVEINHKDSSGNTALLIALMKGKLPLAQLFLDHKNLNANDTNAEGVTALMMAASLGCSLSISKLLRYADIDVNSR